MTELPLTAQLDGHENIFLTKWGESVCKNIARDLNRRHARFELYGHRVSHDRAQREIQSFFSRRA